MRARIRWTQKASKEAAEVSRAGLFTSTPLNLAAASTSSSSTTREQDLTNTRAGKGGSVVLGGLDTLEKTFGGFWRTSLPQKLCVSLDAGFCKLFFCYFGLFTTKSKDLPVVTHKLRCAWRKWSLQTSSVGNVWRLEAVSALILSLCHSLKRYSAPPFYF